MKTLWRITMCLTILLIATPIAGAVPQENVESDSSVQIRSAYCQQVGAGDIVSSNLFIFVSQEAEWPEPLKVTAAISAKGQQIFLDAAEWKTVEERSQSIAFLLLVDHSNSMKSVSGAQNVSSFVRELTRQYRDREKVSYALASFGREFQLEQEFTEDTAVFQEAVNQIEYGERASNPAGAVLAAADYLDGYARSEGELVNLILITDAIPEKVDDDSLALETAAKRIEGESSIVVHTFGLSNPGRDESIQGLDALDSMGSGIHSVTSDTSARNTVRQIAELIDHLWVFQFSTGRRQVEQTLDIGLYFNGSSVAAMRVPNLGEMKMTSEPNPDPENTGDLPSGENPDQQDEGDGKGSSEPVDPNNGNVPSENNAQPISPGSSGAQGTAGGGAGKISLTWIVVGAAGLIALIGVIFILLRRKHDSPAQETEDGAICMVLEVISGECAAKGNRFYLSDELIIGKSRKCDIVWKNNGMAPQSARIFLSDYVVYIEDIGSSNGVYLGGMRLYNANRLRSGDEIAIGSARFRFKF